MSAQCVRLDGRATRLLVLARDFGHLDEAALDELVLAVTEIADPGTEREVTLSELRPILASILFGPAGDATVDPETDLSEDWPILFS